MFDELIDPPADPKYTAAAEFFMSLKRPIDTEKTANVGMVMGGVQKAARNTLRGLASTNKFMSPAKSALKSNLTAALKAGL
jgi:hypothetical protein